MTSIRIQNVRIAFEQFAYRALMKFRATVVDRVTLLNVWVRVEDGAGRGAEGFGSMPLGNVWAFPSETLTAPQTLAAMKFLAGDLERITSACTEPGDPIGLNHLLEPEYIAAGAAAPDPVPALATLVVASPFDAAIHAAWGKMLGRNCYQTYRPDCIWNSLDHYLDHHFRGEFRDRYVSPRAASSLNLYHLVGALDPLTDADVKTRLRDGLPETLEEWIWAEGTDHIKIKLDGNDLVWDVNRILSVDRVASNIDDEGDWRYSLDFNERCTDVEYVLECFAGVREASSTAFDRIQYVEEPTARDLNAPGTPDMRQAASIKPVVIDESLTDYLSLLRGRELGYSGVALKACKGQINALLMAAAAHKWNMFLCVQDLTCPGASLLHSVGIGANVPGITAIESNGRQYVPAANEPWKCRFPGIFEIRDGKMRTAGLDGPGLGVVPSAVEVTS
jgi:L-alanine-DL-glutamate epimerase-like enolase superfamily enzyme